jgi:hypothetical protein
MTFLRSSIAAFALVLTAIPLHAQTPSCTNAVFKGTYYFLVNGSVIPGNQNLPYGSLGKAIADGQGGITGSAVTTVNGVTSAFTITGTYSIGQNCSGTTTLTATSSSTQPNTVTVNLQVVDNGQSAVFAFSTSGQVIAGHGYQVTTTGTPACTSASLNGSYGYLFSGLLSGAPYAEEGQVVSNGSGVLSATSVVNISGTLTSVPAHGTYTLGSDCSGTAQLINQFGTHNFTFAIVEDGRLAVFSETDAGAVISGTANSQSPARFILPDFAFGGGFYSALYFTNQTNSPVSFAVSFFGDDSSALSVPSIGGTSTTVNLAALGTAVIEAPNAGTTIVQGYASLVLPTGVTAYGVFRKTAPGSPDQEVVVPLSNATSTTSSLSFDDTNVVTAVAIVNPSAVATTVTITARDTTGNVIGTSTVPLGPNAKTESVLSALPGLSAITGLRGSADFSVTTGNLAVLGLRFNSQAFTSIPTTDH